jgi:hypothetical protein
MEIEKYAEKEMGRMKDVFKTLKIISSEKNAKEFYSFSENYFKDGIHFFNEKKFIESFEAFIISWSYIDAGMKLKFFSVPKKQEKWFTA